MYPYLALKSVSYRLFLLSCCRTFHSGGYVDSRKPREAELILYPSAYHPSRQPADVKKICDSHSLCGNMAVRNFLRPFAAKMLHKLAFVVATLALGEAARRNEVRRLATRKSHITSVQVRFIAPSGLPRAGSVHRHKLCFTFSVFNSATHDVSALCSPRTTWQRAPSRRCGTGAMCPARCANRCFAAQCAASASVIPQPTSSAVFSSWPCAPYAELPDARAEPAHPPVLRILL